jgi:hypothetical protein
MTDTTATAGETQQASRWEDYIDIFFAPAELFRRRAADRVAPPLITLLVLSVIVYIAMLPATGMIMRSTTAAQPEAAEAIERMGGVLQVIGGISVPITFAIVIAGAAFVLWLVGRVAEIRTDFSRTMLIATYAAFIYLLAQIAGYTAILIHGEAGLDIIRHMSFGPLRFVATDGMNPVILALLRRLEIFAIWQALLWGVGIAVIYRTSRVQAAVTAAATWILVAIPGIIMAALGFGPKAAGG